MYFSFLFSFTHTASNFRPSPLSACNFHPSCLAPTFCLFFHLAPNFLISPLFSPIFRPFPYIYLHRSKPLSFPHLAPNFHLSPKLSCYPLYLPIYASTNRFIINMTVYQVCVSHVTITCTHLLSENQRGVAAGVWLPLATDLEP